MINVQILEPSDIIQPTDWCRPLQITSMSGGMSDSYSFKCMYTGKPENNSKWVLVKHVLGKNWIEKPVSHYLNVMKEFGDGMEFVRGEIPKEHQLDMSEYRTKN